MRFLRTGSGRESIPDTGRSSREMTPVFVGIYKQLEHPYETVAPLQEWDIEISQLPPPCEIPDMDGIPQHLEVAVSNFATECLAVDLAEYQLTVMRKLTEETWLRGFIRN